MISETVSQAYGSEVCKEIRRRAKRYYCSEPMQEFQEQSDLVE